MDASSAQEKIVEPPRHLFFGVEDRRLGGRAGLNEKHLLVEKSRRYQLAETVIASATQLANGIRTMRTFDRTGNADQAIDHIEATLLDLTKQTRNLINEVEASVDRYGDGLDALNARDAAEALADHKETPAAAVLAPQAPAAAGTTRLDGTPGPSPAAVAAQIQANLNRALDIVAGAPR